jgi:L-malate glycosyltransferase
MKVAVIVPALKQTGPVKVMQALVNSLNGNKNIDLKVYYIDKRIDPLVIFLSPTEKLDCSKFPFEEYDIVHTNGIRPDLFAFLNRKKIKYHISTLHNLVFEDLSFTYNRFVSFIFGNIWLILWSKADKLVCVSKTMKNYYEKWFPSSKLEIIYNGVYEMYDSFTPELLRVKTIDSLKLKGLNMIGFSGILNKRKGIDQVLYLLSLRIELALVVFGEGEELKNLQILAEKLNISDRILFFGFTKNAVNYYKYIDFFIMPSRSDGFCLALVEAVQNKVPVICSDLDVFQELFNSDEVTFFKLDDLTSLSEALEVANETSEIKVDLAFSKYLKNFTGKLMGKNYFELYKSA